MPRAARRFPPLDNAGLLQGVEVLAGIDPDLAAISNRYGPPPLWDRPAGFPALIRIILEQQVSLASAKAAYHRLLKAADPLLPERFLGFSDSELKVIGFSRQKAGYGRLLAQALLQGDLNLAQLETMDNAAVITELTKLKGIGVWTADIYLLMVLLRPDVWPRGDIALAVAMQRVKRLQERPDNKRMAAISKAWKPWRSVAARLLWHFYLSEKKTRAPITKTRPLVEQ